ncbi:hypothetical protein [Campylobacter helveticus]|uniref:hypothetical protein n=1 Tax=Campylobacter helveticus TaxID=28898 RepID=UPI0022EB9768|nr:hypothetical protein [Campylobacter helveticus]
MSFVVVVFLMAFFGSVYYFTHFYFNVYMYLFDLPFLVLLGLLVLVFLWRMCLFLHSLKKI